MKLVRRRAKPRNRRVSNTRQRRQQHLLDVKVRSRSASQHRNRRILVGFSKFALLVALAFGLYLGGRLAAKRFFFDNPDYSLKTIDVQTDGSLLREQILKIAALREGENVFRVNLGAVHERLQELPQIDEVEVVRKLPSEIDIKIIERRPIAWITSDQEVADPFASDVAFLVDGRGVLMKEKKLLPEYLGLPLISGCSSESLEAGKVVESYEAKAALDLLRLSTRSFMQTRFQIREIDLSKGYCLVVTDKNHSRVMFGFEEIDSQLQKLEQFLIYADDTKQELATVNLLVQRNIPVTFAKSPAEVINDTIDPNAQPRVLKAPPAKDRPESGTSSAVKPQPFTKKEADKAPTKGSSGVRRAVPIQKGKKD